VNSGHTVFQRKLLKNSECEKYIQYSEKFLGKLCFSGQAQVAQTSGENNFNAVYSVYSHLGEIRVIWVSVLCNLDQSRDWL